MSYQLIFQQRLSTVLNYTTLKHNVCIASVFICLSTVLNYTTLKLNSNTIFTVHSLSTVLNYTTLKRYPLLFPIVLSLSTVLNYTTLKLPWGSCHRNHSLSTVLNYTTLKPQILRKRPTKRMPFNTVVLNIISFIYVFFNHISHKSASIIRFVSKLDDL